MPTAQQEPFVGFEKRLCSFNYGQVAATHGLPQP